MKLNPLQNKRAAGVLVALPVLGFELKGLLKFNCEYYDATR
jgi:hypothetical protein